VKDAQGGNGNGIGGERSPASANGGGGLGGDVASPANAGGANPPRLSPLGASFWDSGAQGLNFRASDSAANARQQVNLGLALMNQGNPAKAIEHFYEAIWLDPNKAEYHWHLVGAAERLGQNHLIERHLLEAVRVDAGYAPAHNALGVWYRRLGRMDVSLYHNATAVTLLPRDPKCIADYASALFQTGEIQAAWDLIEPMVRDPKQQDRWLAAIYARMAPSLGRERDALAVVERALGEPNQPADPTGKPLLHFAAAGLLERLRRYDEAFEQARLANEMVKTAVRRCDAGAHSQFVSRKIEYLTRDRMASLPRATHGDSRPVFIVGMPRSGTSLVEQILASHPQVFGAGELESVYRIADAIPVADWAEREPYPRCLELLSTRRTNKLAAEYLAAIDSRDARSVRYVTDKMPGNYLSLELIELMFPHARIIHCVRSPLDTCLSCYMTNFAFGNEYTLDLTHLGTCYRDYRRIMEHWKRVLSLPILDVRYEDVVLDTESQIRRLLEFLDLPWDDRCLKYYENKRSARTASEDQIRRPIYTSSIGRWKSYESHLGPLIAAMGRSGSREAASPPTGAAKA